MISNHPFSLFSEYIGKHQKKMKEDIDKLWADYLNREPLTERELQILEEWMQASPTNRIFGEFVRELESRKTLLKGRTSPDEIWAALAKRMSLRKKQRRLRVILASCAAVMALAVGMFFLWMPRETPEVRVVQDLSSLFVQPQHQEVELVLSSGEKYMLGEKDTTLTMADGKGSLQTKNKTLIMQVRPDAEANLYYTLNVPYGAEYDLVLPDGTKIYLNAGTTLRYPERFREGSREIYLIGEAYLEVAHDAENPFVVKTNDMDICVLGTTFNVNAYPEGKWVRTTLVEGKVEARCGDRHITMRPGTQVAYDKNTRETGYFPVDTRLYTSWKDGYYDFEDMELEELAQIFTRWYNVQIDFAEPELKNLRFSGRLKRYDSAEELFEMLDYVHRVTFSIENGRIVIRRK